MNTLLVKLSLFFFFLASHLVIGQPAMTNAQKDEFLKDLVLSFENEYLWEQKGKDIARALQAKIDNGDYAEITKAEIFTETLNRDLFMWSGDLHLRVDLYYPKPKESSDTETPSKNTVTSPKPSTFTKEHISEGIYYLKFDTFPGLKASLEEEMEDVLSSFKNPTAIIIDLRDNSGGSDETVNYLAGYFFEEKTKLATSYQWNSEPKQIWALPKALSKSLSKARLIILTSESTFSAAEIFTQRLRLHENTLVVGEPTPGAAHRTTTYLMNDIFLLQWPYEESKLAVSEQDLEGVGIKPDYLVHYNNAKKMAVKLAEKGKNLKYDKIKVPEETNLITDLVEVINSKSIDDVFISKYLLASNQDQILATLQKFKTIWNHTLDARLTNIHYINDTSRIFLKTGYGIIQMKIIMADNKIEKIMYRL